MPHHEYNGPNSAGLGHRSMERASPKRPGGSSCLSCVSGLRGVVDQVAGGDPCPRNDSGTPAEQAVSHSPISIELRRNRECSLFAGMFL